MPRPHNPTHVERGRHLYLELSEDARSRQKAEQKCIVQHLREQQTGDRLDPSTAYKVKICERGENSRQSVESMKQPLFRYAAQWSLPTLTEESAVISMLGLKMWYGSVRSEVVAPYRESFSAHSGLGQRRRHC
jgi:hypothetical protein